MPTPFCDGDIAKMHRYVAAPIFVLKTGTRVPLPLGKTRQFELATAHSAPSFLAFKLFKPTGTYLPLHLLYIVKLSG